MPFSYNSITHGIRGERTGQLLPPSVWPSWMFWVFGEKVGTEAGSLLSIRKVLRWKPMNYVFNAKSKKLNGIKIFGPPKSWFSQHKTCNKTSFCVGL